MIKLEPLEREDFSKIVEWNKDKGADFLLQWAGPLYNYPLTEEQIQNYFDGTKANRHNILRIYKILDQDGKMVGTVEIRKYEKVVNAGRVGRFLIGEGSCRGKGIGKEALTEVVRIGFEELKYNKITLGVFDFNTAAMMCYKSCGFEIEGFTPNAAEAAGGWWNLYDMSVTKKTL